MKKNTWLLVLSLLSTQVSKAQEPGAGIGIYATGSEAGIGYRSAKNTRWALDIRIAKASLFNSPKTGSLVNEASVLYRVAYYEKVRFHLGLGARADWNFDTKQKHRFGAVLPVGVEAYPFPFQNAGLFFEVAPFFTTAGGRNHNAGFRTVAGFAFYFLKKKKTAAEQGSKKY